MKRQRIFPIELQNNITECGLTALKMIARFYGKHISTEKLQIICGTTEKGVSMKGLSMGAQSIGLHSLAIRCTFDELVEYVPLPAIVFWRGQHFIVVYEICEHHITIADPMIGCIYYTYEEFCQHWLYNRGTHGILLAFESIEDVS